MSITLGLRVLKKEDNDFEVNLDYTKGLSKTTNNKITLSSLHREWTTKA